ncbi:MAG: tetratricopeptide repeat protein [Polaromonas sp.]|uniref:YfgM family protein n=1 Tax=Polaromonas sp. TaxID=1869339 RepID=UPI00273147A5|nr:tetratricopeptide repeat protein [Polaromonas sp.]MDP2448881.1 tetratricopeptide repeat protein [Polaromonas sp.]MDP3245839.1 tetratricopeptide repeat protein [Polaromonas sp.]MDP3826513.1 tetratricopeptide repeat protein [Polaromonas sp.]
MAKHLDLEEQEQLDELKHFWKQYGDLITWGLIVIFGAFAAWNGYNYWQRDQSAKAAMMYDEVERAAQSGDASRLDRAMADMKDRFAGTAFAQQAGLLVARTYYDKGNIDAAKASLSWVAGKSADEGYQAIAKLRLAGLLLEAKAYDEALQQLTGTFPKDFVALAADRRGDILAAQGKKSEARAEYEKAYKGMDDRTEYRRLVEVKLNALGLNPSAALAPSVAAAAVSPASAPEVKQ